MDSPCESIRPALSTIGIGQTLSRMGDLRTGLFAQFKALVTCGVRELDVAPRLHMSPTFVIALTEPRGRGIWSFDRDALTLPYGILIFLNVGVRSIVMALSR
jgi:hypothetical protein